MRVIPKVDMQGFFYEDIISLGDFTGVSFHISVDVDPTVKGYIVGYEVPRGLYKPRLNIEELKNKYGEKVEDWPDGRDKELASSFWVEGLTPEEIKAIKDQEDKPNDIQKLQQQINDLTEILLGGI